METVFLISSIFLWIIVLFNLLITFRLIQIVNPEAWNNSIPKLKRGQIAPPFKVITIDGKEVTLSSFKDKKVALIFISWQCTTCLKKITEIQRIGSLANQAGVEVSLICDIEQNKAKALANEFGITIPIYIATRENSIWKQYKVSAVPFYCLIDEKARVTETGILNSNLDTMAKVWKINYIP